MRFLHDCMTSTSRALWPVYLPTTMSLASEPTRHDSAMTMSQGQAPGPVKSPFRSPSHQQLYGWGATLVACRTYLPFPPPFHDEFPFRFLRIVAAWQTSDMLSSHFTTGAGGAKPIRVPPVQAMRSPHSLDGPPPEVVTAAERDHQHVSRLKDGACTSRR